jgi:hypothetical protein
MKQEQANLTFAILKLIKQKESQLVRKVLEQKLNRKPTLREIGSVHKKPNDDNTVEIYFKAKRLGKITYEMIDKELSLNFAE